MPRNKTAADPALPTWALNPTTMSSVRSRGAFIVIEGLDRSGKTTQVATLQTRLETEGIPVKLFKFPGILNVEQAHCSLNTY
jgi:hypothetical protein